MQLKKIIISYYIGSNLNYKKYNIIENILLL